MNCTALSLSLARALSLYYSSSRAVVVALTRCCIAPTCHSDLYHTATWTSILRFLLYRLVVGFLLLLGTHACLDRRDTFHCDVYMREREEMREFGTSEKQKIRLTANCSQPCDFFGFPGWIRSRSITNSTPRHFVESKFWMCVRKSHQ